MSARTKVLLSVAETAVILTAVSMGIILLFASNVVARASGSETPAAGISSLRLVMQSRYCLAGAFFSALGILGALHVSRKLVKSYSGTEAQNARLREANRAVSSMSEARTRFYANMRHEMREPLNSILRLSEHMAGKEETQGEVRDGIAKIHNAGMTLLGIVNSILDFSDKGNKGIELMPVEYDVPSLINDIVTLNAIRVGDRPIAFETHIDARLPRKLFGDDLRVELVCNSLLGNALLFTKKGSIGLSVSCQGDGISERLAIRVTDTGDGFKPEELEEFIFNTCPGLPKSGGNTVKEAEHNYSTAEMLVMMMGGTISAESEYGKGSSFTAYIPQGFVTDAVIGHEFVENMKRFQYRAGKKFDDTNPSRIKFPGARILVVDDVEANLDVARELLEPYGMRVDCLSNGWGAVDLIREGKTRYDAIFMDHMMPDIDGISAVRVIRERIGTKYAQNIPIIALTANAFNGEEEMFLEKGFQALLPKPIDSAKLDEILRGWLWEKEDAEASVPAAWLEPGLSGVSQNVAWHEMNRDIAHTGLERAGALMPI